ncbi:MAG: TMEM175 family protein, partial [Vicinamibacteraceae bacterium]
MAATAEHDVTRLEAFSDAVFGFAITLLVVSLEVPNNFDELMQVMRGLPVFAVTFAILLMIWQEHHGLFKRFPSSDGVTIWLNGALLFVVVSYIYPLKFLFGQIVLPGGLRFGPGGAFQSVEQLVMLMVIYGVGFAAIFLIFATLYWRAARRAVDGVARHEARLMVGHSFVFVAV